MTLQAVGTLESGHSGSPAGKVALARELAARSMRACRHWGNLRNLCMQNPAFISFDWEPLDSSAATECASEINDAGARHLRSNDPPGSSSDASHAALPQPNSDQDTGTDASTDDASLDKQLASASVRRTRRLLNLEKAMFRADAQGRPPGVLVLRAAREGVHRDGPHGGPRDLVFNIGAHRSSTDRCAAA